jgi:hypothetical protein
MTNERSRGGMANILLQRALFAEAFSSAFRDSYAQCLDSGYIPVFL